MVLNTSTFCSGGVKQVVVERVEGAEGVKQSLITMKKKHIKVWPYSDQLNLEPFGIIMICDE